QRNAVLALVSNKLLGDSLDLRRWIRVLGQRSWRRGGEGLSRISGGRRADEGVRWGGRSFPSGYDFARLIVEQCDYGFKAVVVAPEQTLGLQGLQIKAAEKWPVSLSRCSLAPQVDVVSILKYGPAASPAFAHTASASSSWSPAARLAAQYGCARVIVAILLVAAPQLT